RRGTRRGRASRPSRAPPLSPIPVRSRPVTRRTSPPFRADHVGSLLRPRRLLQAREDFAAGRITADDLRSVEDQEIPGAIRMQEEVGLQSATDGEFRRTSWHMDFIYALGGVSKAPGKLAVTFTNPSGTIEWTPAALHIGGKIRLDHTIFGGDFTFLKSPVTTAGPNAALRAGSTRRCTRIWRSSGPTWPPPTPGKCGGSASWAAPTCSSTTPPWP